MIMGEKVLIFGKDNCPYTSDARADYSKRNIPFDYINVIKNPDNMEKMLKFSEGQRDVPVIVENGKVIVGFGGT